MPASSRSDATAPGASAPGAPGLTPEAMARYGRHLALPGVGLEGQRRLSRASVLVVGAGGLGSPAAMYLAAAGVGRLGIVDADRVELSNLQRQILHGTSDVGRPKTASARERLVELNPDVDVVVYQTRLTAANALDVLRGWDIVVDGTDNFPTRYLVNDACILLGIPYVYGSIIRFEGQASVFGAPDGPCYRCLFPEPPPPGSVPNCAEGGVLGVLPGLVGSIQATQALELVLGIGEPLVGRLLLVDALAMRFRTIALRRDPACPACGTRELRALVDYEAFCGVTPAGEVTTTGDEPSEMGVRELAERLARGDDLTLLDVREAWEFEYARIPGARLLPLGTLAAHVPTLDPGREYVMQCHHGVRSRHAAEMLCAAGFRRVHNLTGGIDAWSVEVDPGVPRY